MDTTKTTYQYSNAAAASRMASSHAALAAAQTTPTDPTPAAPTEPESPQWMMMLL